MIFQYIIITLNSKWNGSTRKILPPDLMVWGCGQIWPIVGLTLGNPSSSDSSAYSACWCPAITTDDEIRIFNRILQIKRLLNIHIWNRYKGYLLFIQLLSRWKFGLFSILWNVDHYRQTPFTRKGVKNCSCNENALVTLYLHEIPLIWVWMSSSSKVLNSKQFQIWKKVPFYLIIVLSKFFLYGGTEK